MLALSEERAYRSELPPNLHSPSGKLRSLGAKSRACKGSNINSKACCHAVRDKPIVTVSPVAHLHGYRLDGTVNGVSTSFLLDTGSAVTLLQKDTWDWISVTNPQKLSPWSKLQLVGVDGSPLIVHGSTSIDLELQGRFSLM